MAAARLWAFGSAQYPYDALNRIIHATDFEVGFAKLPDDAPKVVGGAIVVNHLLTRTDQRDEALIDVFARASCFFFAVLPELHVVERPPTPEGALVHKIDEFGLQMDSA